MTRFSCLTVESAANSDANSFSPLIDSSSTESTFTATILPSRSRPFKVNGIVKINKNNPHELKLIMLYYIPIYAQSKQQDSSVHMCCSDKKVNLVYRTKAAFSDLVRPGEPLSSISQLIISEHPKILMILSSWFYEYPQN